MGISLDIYADETDTGKMQRMIFSAVKKNCSTLNR